MKKPKCSFKEVSERAGELFGPDDEDDWVWEQDFAKAHSTWLPHCKHPESLLDAPKMDDFWQIERVWAIMAAEVYRYPEPKCVKQLLNRVKESHKNLQVKTLTKLCHQMKAKVNEIYRLKGKKINPTWDPKTSKHSCLCDVCQEI